MYLGARLPEGVYGVFEFHQHYFKVDILTWEFSNKKNQNNSILVSREWSILCEVCFPFSEISELV